MPNIDLQEVHALLTKLADHFNPNGSSNIVPNAGNYAAGGGSQDFDWGRYEVYRRVSEELASVIKGTAQIVQSQYSAMQNLATPSTMQMAAVQAQANAGYWGSGAPFGFAALGFLAGLPFGNPLAGAAIGGAIGQGVGGVASSIYGYQADIRTLQAQAQMNASMIGYYTGSAGFGGSAQGFFNQPGISGTYGTAAGLGGLYASLMGDPRFSGLTPEGLSARLRTTMSPDFPTGNLQVLSTMYQQAGAVAGLYPSLAGLPNAEAFLNGSNAVSYRAITEREFYARRLAGQQEKGFWGSIDWDWFGPGFDQQVHQDYQSMRRRGKLPTVPVLTDGAPGYDLGYVARFGDPAAQQKAIQDATRMGSSPEAVRATILNWGLLTSGTSAAGSLASAGVSGFESAIASGMGFVGLRGAAGRTAGGLLTSANWAYATADNLARALNPGGLSLDILAATGPQGQMSAAKIGQAYQAAAAAAASVPQFMQQSQELDISRRNTVLQGAGITAGLGVTRSAYSSDLGDVGSAYGGAQAFARRRAAAFGDYATNPRYSNLPPELRALYGAQAQEYGWEANVDVPRAYAEDIFGRRYAGGQSALSGGLYGLSRARTFGGYADIAGTSGSVAGGFDSMISAYRNLLSDGLRTEKEKLEISTHIKDLERQKMETVQAIVSETNRVQMGVAGAATGTAAAGAQRAILQGTGGVAGVQAMFGVVTGKRGEVSAAQDVIARLKANGYAENSLEMSQAREQLANAQLGVTQAELGMGDTPFSLGLRRTLSSQEYTAQVLSSMPGAYGNLRGALTGQLGTLGKMSQELKQEYQAAMRSASPENRDAIAFEFQQRQQALGLQQAQVFQQLSYGWESRLISNVMGMPGSFSGQMNRFSYMAAVLGGVRNPLFGSNMRDLPGYLQNALYPGSIAGSTGTPEGFAITALAGARPRAPRDGGLAVPGVPGANVDAGTQKIVVEVVLKWPDGSEAGRATVHGGAGGSGIVGNFSETISNLFTQMNQGNN